MMEYYDKNHAYKEKIYPLQPRALRRWMQGGLGVLAINWVFQGMRGMDRGERSLRLACEALFATALAAPIARFGVSPGVAALSALLLAHTAFFALNGQLWVCARYGARYRCDVERLRAWAKALERRIAAQSWLDEALVTGSGASGQLGARSDFDVRLVAPASPSGFLRAHGYAFVLRMEAALRGKPLDLYVVDEPRSLDRLDPPLRLLLDRRGRLARRFGEDAPT